MKVPKTQAIEWHGTGAFGRDFSCDLDAASTRSGGQIRSPLCCLKLLLPTGHTVDGRNPAPAGMYKTL